MNTNLAPPLAHDPAAAGPASGGGDLTPEHLKQLDASGIALEVREARNPRSVTPAEARKLGFCSQQAGSGLLFPILPPDGSNGVYQLRRDKPRQDKDGKDIKYETPKSMGLRIDRHPFCDSQLGDPSIELWITEGVKKGDALVSHGYCAIALLGVWGFVGKNQFGAVTFLNDWRHIALKGRIVNIVFDSDVSVKPSVQKALLSLIDFLKAKGAVVNVVYLPPQANGEKCGVDDFLLTHANEELEALKQGPRPAPKAASPVFELLDAPPPALSRPLQLVDASGYAVAWLYTKCTRSESYDEKHGQIIRHDPPIVTTEKRLFVLRDDGTVYGDGGDKLLSELGFEVRLPDVPRDSKLLSAKAVANFRGGYRPLPLEVFRRLVGLIDRFMSFDRSLAEQRVMCELVACYALSTWFLDAFSVIGFLWPNGGYGSGKSKLGILICEVAYLGEALLSGSSYACLRDLADMGATLLFDDAEAVSDPKKADPDKRNLLLAGNRRGTTVTVKESGPDGTWKTRFVNGYCPRLFTAIRLPDNVLASRTIVLPLVRTADPRKANAEVLDYSQWPSDQRKLLDDLWLLAVSNLAQLPAHESAVNQAAPLVGRNLEPWRPVLSVAHWLEDAGEAGLYERMVSLAKSYQTERATLEVSDITRLVVQALVDVVASATSLALVASAKAGVAIEINVSDIVKRVNELAIEQDIAEENGTDYASSKRVGKVLTALRIKQGTKTATTRTRKISPLELNSLAIGYGLGDVVTFEMANGPLPDDSPLTPQTAQTPSEDTPDAQASFDMEREGLEL